MGSTGEINLLSYTSSSLHRYGEAYSVCTIDIL